MKAPALDALQAEVARFGALIDSLDEQRWTLPTRCPPLTVFELSVHVLRGGLRLKDMVGGDRSDDEPEKDAVTYFQYDPKDVAPGVVHRAQEEAMSRTPQSLQKEWEFVWAGAFAEAGLVLDHEDPVYYSVYGTMRLGEYIKTRIVEVGVHHMDVRDALGLEPDPEPAALEHTAEILRALLGTDLRPFGLDDLRFVLTGTGRLALTDHERGYLGPLAESFPLLS